MAGPAQSPRPDSVPENKKSKSRQGLSRIKSRVEAQELFPDALLGFDCSNIDDAAAFVAAAAAAAAAGPPSSSPPAVPQTPKPSSQFDRIPGPAAGHCRMEAHGGIILKYVSPTETWIDLIFSFDAKIPILPVALINAITKRLCFLMLTLLNKAMREFDGSIYADRKAANPALYGYIDERLAELETEHLAAAAAAAEQEGGGGGK